SSSSSPSSATSHWSCTDWSARCSAARQGRDDDLPRPGRAVPAARRAPRAPHEPAPAAGPAVVDRHRADARRPARAHRRVRQPDDPRRPLPLRGVPAHRGAPAPGPGGGPRLAGRSGVPAAHAVAAAGPPPARRPGRAAAGRGGALVTVTTTAALRQLLGSTRPVSWINTAYPFAAAYLMAGGTVDLTLVLGTIYFLVPYNLLMYGLNDVFDYES